MLKVLSFKVDLILLEILNSVTFLILASVPQNEISVLVRCKTNFFCCVFKLEC